MSSSEPFVEARIPVTATITSFDATPIVYDLYDRPSRSLVLVVPGFWRDRKHPAMLRLASKLAANGYAVAMCDPRGHGDSGGTFGFNLYEHYDVAAVAEDALRRLAVDSITLMGFSYGGAIAVTTAARHSLPINSLLLISSVADFHKIMPRINPFTIHRHIALGQALKRPSFDWHLRKSPKLQAVDDIANVHVPVCLVHVKNDWLIDHSHSVMLYEAANEPKELHIIDVPGNYHADRIFHVAGDTVEPILDEFLARTTPR